VVDGTQLFRTVETDGIAPPVPTTIRVGGVGGNRLRVDDDDVVQLSDLVVARVSSELVLQVPPARMRYYVNIKSQPSHVVGPWCGADWAHSMEP